MASSEIWLVLSFDIGRNVERKTLSYPFCTCEFNLCTSIIFRQCRPFNSYTTCGSSTETLYSQLVHMAFHSHTACGSSTKSSTAPGTSTTISIPIPHAEVQRILHMNTKKLPHHIQFPYYIREFNKCFLTGIEHSSLFNSHAAGGSSTGIIPSTIQGHIHFNSHTARGSSTVY